MFMGVGKTNDHDSESGIRIDSEIILFCVWNQSGVVRIRIGVRI